jgi:serine/threonine protein kinase
MGAIFEAEHMATERRVALKLLYPHITSVASARQKFELEAKVSARVNSPHIVEVLDAGFDESSKSPFLVMELLEGQTLAERIYEQGPLAPREALHLLQQVAAGLDAAHSYLDPDGTPKPIVHRDLKPENLFLARTHEGVINAKIVDYGIAKMLGNTSNSSQEVRGTPLFMAFEQITAGSLSAQTDIWAFGLIAFYMLAGIPYWRSADRESLSVQSLFAEILTLPLELPSVRLREQGSCIELPPGFDPWLLRCIHRDPTQRFPTVTAAVEALARAFDVVLEDCSLSPVRLLTSAERTQHVSSAPAAGETPSAGSAPATAAAIHRPARPVRMPTPSFSWHHVAAGALAGALPLGGIAWLVADDDAGPSRAAVPARESSAIAASRPADRAPNGAVEGAGAVPVFGERRLEANQAPAPSLGGPNSPDSRADPVDDDATQSWVAESSDDASHTRSPSPAAKPAKPKRKARQGSGEAYRIR